MRGDAAWPAGAVADPGDLVVAVEGGGVAVQPADLVVVLFCAAGRADVVELMMSLLAI